MIRAAFLSSKHEVPLLPLALRTHYPTHNMLCQDSYGIRVWRTGELGT